MRTLFVLLFLALAAAYGQETLTSVAVLPSDASDNTVLNNDELEVLTDKMRQAALRVLPTSSFVVLTRDVVVRRLGGADSYIKICTESSCIVDLGKLAQVDYVSQASVGKLGNKLRLKVELYDVRTEGLVSMLSDEMSENVMDLLSIVENRVPAEVFGNIPGSTSHFLAVATGGLENAVTTVPAMSYSQAPAAKPKPRYTMSALAFDFAGAVLISAGIVANANMQNALDKYGEVDKDPEHYKDAWAKVESSRRARNVRYVAGCLFLVSGIGVHIWF